MQEELSKNQEKQLEGLAIVVYQELADGVKKEIIIARLVKEFKIPNDIAVTFVDDVEREFGNYLKSQNPDNPAAVSRQLSEKFVKKIVYGSLWVIGGGYIAWLMYSEGEVSKLPYIITFGAFAFGLFNLYTGLNGWMKNRK